jgi:uncharacterized phage protein (TIGR02218 family)
MRVLPPALAAKLDSGVTTLAHAWRLTRRDGLVVAVTQHDRDLTFGGTIFVAAQSFIGGDHEKEVSLGASRTALSGALVSSAITEDDLALGRWDHAKVEAFWVDWTAPTNFIPIWGGIVAGASWRGNAFELDIVGPASVLNREIGRVYAKSCDAVLGDTPCKVDLAISQRTISTSIAGVLSDRSVTIPRPNGADAKTFIGGVASILSGPAISWRNDVVRISEQATLWTIHLSRPFPVAPLPSDAISLTMGCDKSFATCRARFANGLNFRGQPTLPGDDVAFGGPAVSGNTGSKR